MRSVTDDFSGIAVSLRLDRGSTYLGRPGMTTWLGASISSTDVGGQSPGRLHTWPHSLVRWLFGRGEEEHAPTTSAGTVARFQNICISREAGAAGEDIARLVGQ